MSAIISKLLIAIVVAGLGLLTFGGTIAASKAEPVTEEGSLKSEDDGIITEENMFSTEGSASSENSIISGNMAMVSTPTDYEEYEGIQETESLELSLASEGGIMLASNMAGWNAHSWSASYNGSNLVFTFDIDFYATGNGYEYFYPKYTFGSTKDPTVTRTPFNILDASSSSRVSSNYGTVNLTEFSCVGGSSPYARRLKMKGTVTINSSRLSTLNSGVTFRYYAGGWKDGDWASAENANYTVANFSTAIAQAVCKHSSYTYTSSGSSGHVKKCSSCGYSATEAHTLSSGKCSECSYVSSVSVTLNYVLNGKQETETLPLTPGEKYQPKSIKGYKTPEQITIPAAGGTVSISYEPISYTITDGINTYTLKYDDSLLIPEIEKKGYVQREYVITQVS